MCFNSLVGLLRGFQMSVYLEVSKMVIQLRGAAFLTIIYITEDGNLRGGSSEARAGRADRYR